MVFYNPFSNAIRFYKEKLLSTTQYTVDVLLRICIVVLILATFFASSVFLYITFYNAQVPNVMHSYPVHLYYEQCGSSRESDRCVDPESSVSECPFPRGHIQLTKENRLLMVGQSYKISVILDFPESPSNYDAGMFMVCVQLVSKSSVTVAHSCRSASLRFRSPLVHALTTLTFAPFYIWGSMEEKQTSTIELFSDFDDSALYPVTDVFVEVKSHKVEVYTSKLQINAQMSGLRYIMFYWRTTSAIFGVTFIFGFLTFVVSLSLWQLYGPHNEAGREYIYEGIDRITKFRFLKKPKQDKLASSEENISEDVFLLSDEGEESGKKFLSDVQRLESSSEA